MPGILIMQFFVGEKSKIVKDDGTINVNQDLY